MGTWDVGPFDNDAAADWCGALNAAAPERRAALIRAALSRVAGHGDDYLDGDDAAQAIAAAAIVAAQLPGGTPTEPDFPLEDGTGDGGTGDGGTIEVAGDVPAIAVRALDRVVAPNSEWRALWEESAELYPRALGSVRALRATLERAISR